MNKECLSERLYKDNFDNVHAKIARHMYSKSSDASVYTSVWYKVTVSINWRVRSALPIGEVEYFIAAQLP